MKKFSVAVLVTLAMPTHAFTVRGVGSIPCMQWNDGQSWDAKVQYALGFISGAESIRKPQITTGTNHIDNNTIIQAVTEWCRQNPRNDIAEALMAASDIMNR